MAVFLLSQCPLLTVQLLCSSDLEVPLYASTAKTAQDPQFRVSHNSFTEALDSLRPLWLRKRMDTRPSDPNGALEATAAAPAPLDVKPLATASAQSSDAPPQQVEADLNLTTRSTPEVHSGLSGLHNAPVIPKIETDTGREPVPVLRANSLALDDLSGLGYSSTGLQLPGQHSSQQQAQPISPQEPFSARSLTSSIFGGSHLPGLQGAFSFDLDEPSAMLGLSSPRNWGDANSPRFDGTGSHVHSRSNSGALDGSLSFAPPLPSPSGPNGTAPLARSFIPQPAMRSVPTVPAPPCRSGLTVPKLRAAPLREPYAPRVLPSEAHGYMGDFASPPQGTGRGGSGTAASTSKRGSSRAGSGGSGKRSTSKGRKRSAQSGDGGAEKGPGDAEDRGKYRCGRCGKLKVNHVCTAVDEAVVCRAIEVQASPDGEFGPLATTDPPSRFLIVRPWGSPPASVLASSAAAAAAGGAYHASALTAALGGQVMPHSTATTGYPELPARGDTGYGGPAATPPLPHASVAPSSQGHQHDSGPTPAKQPRVERRSEIVAEEAGRPAGVEAGPVNPGYESVGSGQVGHLPPGSWAPGYSAAEQSRDVYDTNAAYFEATRTII